MKYLLLLMIYICITTLAFGKTYLKEIRTASNDILVAFIWNNEYSTSGNELNINEVDISDNNKWKINGTPVTEIFRYSMKSDLCDNHIYLKTSKLINGKEYKIETPYGDTTITFDDQKIFCESIKTNQAAYSSLSKSKYALFSIWLGDGGAKNINGELPEYEVFELKTGKNIANGKLKELGEDGSSGDYVYKIDLSNISEGGPYKIRVKGYGVSYPFGVGGKFSKKVAHVMFRGLYHQRCGIPLVEPYTWDIRMNPCHTVVYDVDADLGEAHVDVNGDEPQFPIYGGYHDAGDADRRGHHMAVPIVLLTTYEAFPELFTDRQFNIPDKFDNKFYITGSGNGIPDIIDEAIWGTLVWEYLQDETGGVHWQNECRGYPEPFEAPLDKDDKKYGTVRIDNRTTGLAAGLFLHLARIIEPYDLNKSKDLIYKAEKARSYIGNSISKPHELYYSIQRYLLLGDEKAHKRIKELKYIAEDFVEHSFDDPGDIGEKHVENAGYFFSYIVAKNKPTDPEIVKSFKSIIKKSAEKNIQELRKYFYPIGHNVHLRKWGANIAQNQYAYSNLLQWKLSGEQKYIDAACELMDWSLGLNPLGISYVTELGFHQVHNPHDRECSYTMQLGLGNKPGITVYGPGILHGSMDRYNNSAYPHLESLKRGRQFADDRNNISLTEFTVHQTMAYQVCFTILSKGGIWDGKDPYKINK